jgi:hypothetical protein
MSCIKYLENIQQQEYEKAIVLCQQRNRVLDCKDCKLNSMCGLLNV